MSATIAVFVDLDKSFTQPGIKAPKAVENVAPAAGFCFVKFDFMQEPVRVKALPIFAIEFLEILQRLVLLGHIEVEWQSRYNNSLVNFEISYDGKTYEKLDLSIIKRIPVSHTGFISNMKWSLQKHEESYFVLAPGEEVADFDELPAPEASKIVLFRAQNSHGGKKMPADYADFISMLNERID